MVEISVIIPCYNCAKWIGRCLDALDRQTYKDFEVICIDDCSTDDTVEELQRKSAEVSFPMQIIPNKVNLGPAASRNCGISQATGKLLAFCDSDDWYDDTYLEEMYAALSREDADLVMCEYRKIYESNGKTVEMHYLKQYEPGGNREDLLAYSKAAMWLLLYKKELTGDLAVPDLRNGEDIAYVPCLESRAEKIAIVKKPLYNYVMRQDSASKTPSINVYRSLLTAFDFIRTNFRGNKPDVLEYLGIKTVMYGAVLNACKAKESRKTIKGIIDTFEKRYPNWKCNKYMFLFGKNKQLFLRAVSKKRILFCQLYAYMHQRFSV